MSDVSRQHGEAVRVLVVAAVLPLQVQNRYRVYLGEVTDAEADIVLPYLVIWPPPAMLPFGTLAGYNGEANTTTQITAVGASLAEALAALDRAAAGLVGRRPVIGGRSCGLVAQVPGTVPPARDDSVHTPDGRPLFNAFALFSLRSTAA